MKLYVALDYDDTFTVNPIAWYPALEKLKAAGFSIIGVTLRNEEQKIEDPLYLDICDVIVYCAGHAKKDTVHKLLHHTIHIWIDDSPEYITNSYYTVNPNSEYGSDLKPFVT